MRSLTCSLLCLAIFLSPLPSAANSKEDAARQLLDKSYRQADIWTQGPLQLDADVTVPQNGKPPVQLNYKISWASPNKWRLEWSGAGYSRVIVVNDGKMYRSSSTAVPPVVVLEYERALGALNGRGYGGPSGATPDLSGAKVEVAHQKFGKVQAECIRVKGPYLELCVDPSSAQAVSTTSTDLSKFLFSDYAPVGSASFPTSIRHVADPDKQVLLDSRVSVTVPANLPESLFTPPAAAVASDYAACSEGAGTLQGGRLEKKVTPVYPQNAKLNRHQGTVLLYAILGKDGSIQILKPVSAYWPELQESAMEAVKDWKYSPYLRCGQPIEVEMLISVNYSLTY